MHKQKNKELPNGIPEQIYHCPDQYGGEKCGVPLTEEDLLDVATYSEVPGGPKKKYSLISYNRKIRIAITAN